MGRVGVSVPFMDLPALHAPLRDALLEDIAGIIDTGAFINGPHVRRFEGDFAGYCGREHCVGMASGLDALRLALQAAGAGEGDEVILPAQTFVATAEAVSQVGARPVLADVSEADYNIDPALAQAAVTDATRLLLPVHLYGQLADMDALEALAERRGLRIVEDAAQAHGAVRDGRRAGGSGLAGAFSFYPAKNLGALGDAGACVTDDPELADAMRALREHGQWGKHEHGAVGWTARLDTIQAAALTHKLPLLDGWNDQRRQAATLYSHALEGVGDLRLPPVAPGSEPVWHVYVVRTARPDALAASLDERGIGSGRHYPTAIHLTDAYAHLGHGPGDFPVAEALAGEGLSLPIYPGITEEQLETVVAAVRDHFDGG
jgi:dTDP-4-amino-4,6-dideoxygalactose transaminase